MQKSLTAKSVLDLHTQSSPDVWTIEVGQAQGYPTIMDSFEVGPGSPGSPAMLSPVEVWPVFESPSFINHNSNPMCLVAAECLLRLN